MIIFNSEHYPQFSNFWPAPIVIHGEQYQTSEHYYQMQKFDNAEIREKIKLAPKPGKAKSIANKKANIELIRPEWLSIREDIMFEAIQAKFTQHESLKRLLLSTKNEAIIKGNIYDEFWGIGTGNGKNRLGQLLMRLRTQLNTQPTNQVAPIHRFFCN